MSHTTRSQLEGSAVNYGVDTDLVQPSLPKLQRSQFMQPPASVYEESMTQNTITTNGHMKASGWPLGYGERRSGGAQDNTVNSDATHLQQHTLQQSRLTVDADPTTAPTFATPSTMLDVVLGVEVKQQDREEGVRQLGVSVRTSRGGMNGVSRLLTIRLTDPSDPFFLFELELLEEDYGVFKQRLELLVDFSGFPQYFVNMVHKVAMGLGALQLCFVVNSSDAGRGTLRIIEITEYKTVEHISVLLIRQGDAGQKKYLAERYQHFEKLYVCTAAERKEEAAAASRAIDDLSRRNEELTELQRKNGEALKLVSTQSEMMQLSAANTLKESHMQELKSMRAELELKLSETQKRLEYLQTQTQSDGLDKEKQLNQLRDKLRESESALTTLRSQHRLMEDTNTTYLEELTKLRSTNAELTSHKLETTRLMSENEVNYVSLKERLAGANSALKERKEEIVSLRTQNEQQDGYISMLTTQNEKLSEQQKLTERKLEKANYIIANQLQNIKSGKERHTIALDQLRSQAALLQERQNAHDRVKEELSSANERIRSLLGKNTELKEQLKKTDDAREKLASELKQNQNALVQLQRSTTINGRHWTIPSGAPTPMNSYAMGQTSFGSTHLGSVPLPTGTTPSPHVSGARDWNRAGSQASRAPSASRASDGNGIATALFTTPLAPNYSGSTPRQAAESASSLEKTEPKRVADTIVAHMNQPNTIAKTAGSLMAKTFLENGDAAAVVSAYF